MATDSRVSSLIQGMWWLRWTGNERHDCVCRMNELFTSFQKPRSSWLIVKSLNYPCVAVEQLNFAYNWCQGFTILHNHSKALNVLNNLIHTATGSHLKCWFAVLAWGNNKLGFVYLKMDSVIQTPDPKVKLRFVQPLCSC